MLPVYQNYLNALKKTDFSGEIRSDYAARLAVATDNSVYQVIPQAVIHPKSTQDIAIALILCQQEHFQQIKFSPRGGGTGTNGQSLSSGIVIDCSKFMREILEVNLQEGWIRVQPGVILDQLNAYLKPYSRYFPPEISPSNRATIGGMINTDACGNGSRTLGRTSDYLIDLTCVLSDGRVIHTQAGDDSLRHSLTELLTPYRQQIEEKFTARPRNLSGYNLLKTLTDQLNLHYLISGSEGTLAIVTECKLKIKPIPQYKELLLVKYKNFDDALREKIIGLTDVLLTIESIDEKLLDLAREDSIYFQIKNMLDENIKAGAINLIEISAQNEEQVSEAVKSLCQKFDNDTQILGYYQAKNPVEIKLLWELRKKSVGLISKRKQGTRRPIPFIEDTAVPPEKLADYISEFKKFLDQHQLVYGMYGHVDAGCIHVRPALDLQWTEDENLFRELSDKVVLLVEKYGGVMWGEHGVGFRSHYAEHFFGKELYAVVRQIKTLFDPQNRLNPGKIAAPLNSVDPLVKLTDTLRSHSDKQIPAEKQQEFATVMACNGNGACFNYATQEVMCPSYKVTKDRVHSPKGRATLMREWLRLSNTKNSPDISHEVYAAMNGCLSCKACASQCPLNVDVPEFKSTFLFNYHQHYFRPLRDYVIANAEKMTALQAKFPRLFQWILKRKVTHILFKKLIKMIDVPIVSSLSLKNELKKRNALKLDLSTANAENSVILLQDTFTSFYEPELVLKIYDYLCTSGVKVYVLPFFPNGKPYHVKGFLPQFSRVARKNINYLRRIAASGIPMIGVDPSVTLTYRDEYKKIMGKEALGFQVKLLQEWLVEKLSSPKQFSGQEYYLLSHCTEKTACVAAEKQWQIVFTAHGLKLTPLSAGCCGMAGSYGHEVEHEQQSKTLFAMDWETYLRDNSDTKNTVLVTGYSCRSQVKRLTGIKVKHPVEVLFQP